MYEQDTEDEQYVFVCTVKAGPSPEFVLEFCGFRDADEAEEVAEMIVGLLTETSTRH